MPIHLWLAFVAASAVLLIIPGPTILTVISYSMSHGRRANVPLVAAVVLGDSTALVVSLLGLGALLATSAFWFTMVKWAGGLYLIFLGIKLLRAGATLAELAAPAAPGSRWRLFFNTWLVTALNPKGIIFFVAFLPQFISPASAVGPQLWVLALTFVAMATLNATLYAVFAASARRFLASPRARRGFHLMGGSLLSVAGVWACWRGAPPDARECRRGSPQRRPRSNGPRLSNGEQGERPGPQQHAAADPGMTATEQGSR